METTSEFGVLFVDRNIFGDELEHEYDCLCNDGFAVGIRVYDDDKEAPVSVIVKYPTLSSLTDEQKDYVLKYRGLYEWTRDDITCGDVMLAYGKINSFTKKL